MSQRDVGRNFENEIFQDFFELNYCKSGSNSR